MHPNKSTLSRRTGMYRFAGLCLSGKAPHIRHNLARLAPAGVFDLFFLSAPACVTGSNYFCSPARMDGLGAEMKKPHPEGWG
jgi:hypothetical protein